MAPAPGAACLCGPRRTSCGRCPCGPSRAAARVRAACCRRVGVGIRAAHLVARVLIDASPVAMVVAAILEVVAVLSGYGQSAACCQRAALRIAPYHIVSYHVASRLGRAHNDAGRCAARARAPTRRPTVAQSGDKQRTHPFDAIAIIGTMLSSRRASWAGSVA